MLADIVYKTKVSKNEVYLFKICTICYYFPKALLGIQAWYYILESPKNLSCGTFQIFPFLQLVVYILDTPNIFHLLDNKACIFLTIEDLHISNKSEVLVPRYDPGNCKEKSIHTNKRYFENLTVFKNTCPINDMWENVMISVSLYPFIFQNFSPRPKMKGMFKAD